MVPIFLAALLLPGLAGVLMSRPFEPTPKMAPLRYLVTGAALGVGAALVVSLWSDWWVVDDQEREEILLTEGASGFPIFVVAMGLAACLLTVLAAWGRRNWAPMAFTFLWLLLAIAWYLSSGESVDSDAFGEALPGLELATWASLAGTGVALVGSLGRLAERAALWDAAESWPGGGPTPPSAPGVEAGAGPRRVTAGDLAAIGFALVSALLLFGVGPDGVLGLLLLLAVVAVFVRVRIRTARR